MRQASRGLILITIDCLRADHVGFLGYSGGTTPFLDSLAKESFVFSNALASGIPTYYSLPALFASRYPLALGRDVIGIAPGETTLAEEMRECGYRTAAFVAGNPYASAAFGYSNGFDVFCDFLEPAASDFAIETDRELHPSLLGNANSLLSRASHRFPALGKAYDEIYFRYCQTISNSAHNSLDELRKFPSADVIVDSAIAWLHDNANSPFFLWLHFMDPHGPYYPKAEGLKAMGHSDFTAAEAKYLNSYWARGDLGPTRLRNKKDAVLDLYDAGVRWADAQISKLAARLVELDLWEKCALAITADHGEEFMDHGGRFHSPFKLYQELIRVPLLVRHPGCSNHGVVPAPFGMIDLAPTLLEAFGISPPASFRGRSCWRKLLTQQPWNHPVFTECSYGCTNPFRGETRNAPRLLSVRKGDYKLIINFATQMHELFELTSDPKELNALPFGTATAIRRDLMDRARRHVAESHKSRDLQLRMAAKARELRLEWAHSSSARSN